jgi:hypothetical protein
MKIALSAKHGVNPSVQRCFWCGKSVGVALFGRLPVHRAKEMFGEEFAKNPVGGEVEAPREVILDMEPCEGCEVWAHSKEGIFVVQAEDGESGPKPTGTFLCVKEDAVKSWLDHGELLDSALKHRIVFMTVSDYDEIFKDVPH